MARNKAKLISVFIEPPPFPFFTQGFWFSAAYSPWASPIGPNLSTFLGHDIPLGAGTNAPKISSGFLARIYLANEEEVQ